MDITLGVHRRLLEEGTDPLLSFSGSAQMQKIRRHVKLGFNWPNRGLSVHFQES